MTVLELFEKHNDEYLKFDRVENKRSERKDLHAFLLLDELFPSTSNLISATEHDEFFLSINDEQEESLKESQVIELIRCGVGYSRDYACLSMFV